jgi:hypothetical protein
MSYSIIDSAPPAQDLLCHSVRTPVFEQTLGEARIFRQGVVRPLARQLGGDLGCLVPKPLGYELLRLPARL